MITNTTNNNIPKPIDKVISLGGKALIGAQTEGAGIPLKINTAVEIGADLHLVIGDPATPLVPGTQSKYAAQKHVLRNRFTAVREAIAAGRAYCSAAIGVLRPVLGTRWNSQWNAAGFVQPTLAVPRDPAPMLARFREYFNANPAQEVAARNVTAAVAQARYDAIQAGILSVAQARDLLVELMEARDASLEALRSRLSGLRSELDQALADNDGRWYDFGFRRPIDSRIPSPVAGLVLAPVGPGAISVAWDLSTRAVNYRVSWRVDGGSSPVTVLGLFTDRQCLITGLPAGSTIVVMVSARNSSGETAPTEAAIIAP